MIHKIMQQMGFQMRTKNLFSLSLVAATAALVTLNGCTDSGFSARAGIDPQPAVKANPIVTQSLSLRPTGQAGVNTNQAHLTLQKAALDKEFLLQGELIQQQPAPAFNGLKSHVVAFKQFNGKLAMLDANKGHEITEDLPQNLLLAQFPIVAESDKEITFDFNAGMTSIFADGDWYAQDDQGLAYNYTLNVAKVRASYVDQAWISSKSNTVVINQVLNAEATDPTGQAQLQPLVVKYYLSPYNPDSSFQPTLSTGFKNFGFFQVAPQLLPDGSSFIRSSKWNTQKPLTYAISANTPPDFRKPIADAVLYWNSVMGKDFVSVIQLEDKSITAPNPDYNIIQWVENDAAGAAYADAQMDPRSGEILHAQIYMTSVFGDLGKLRAERDLRDNGLKAPTGRRFFTLQGFAQTGLCELKTVNALAHTDFVSISAQGQGTALKVAQDYVRETVAHEVGHTLGLRHNFAGNLGANLALAKRADLYTEYLKTGKAPEGVSTTSSIMDYELFEESTLTGDQVSRQVAHLDYDIKAIRNLYLGETPDSVPPFCTDGDLKKYQDCQQFDTGRSLVEYLSWQTAADLARAPLSVINTYITDKVPNSLGDLSLPVNQVAIDPTPLALEIVASRFAIYKALTKEGSLIAVKSTFPFVNTINQLIVGKAQTDYLRSEFTAYGGLVNNYALFDDSVVDAQLAQFTNLLNSPGYGSGTLKGVAYSFTDQEKQVMVANAALYFKKLNEQLTTLDLISLTGADLPAPPPAPGAGAPPAPPADPPPPVSLLDNDLSNQVLDLVKARMDKYMLTLSGQTIQTKLNVTAPDETGKPALKSVNVELPVFKYPLKVRLASAGVLGKAHSESLAWGAQTKSAYAAKMTDLVNKALGTTVDAVDVKSLSPEAFAWLAEAQAVIGALSGQ